MKNIENEMISVKRTIYYRVISYCMMHKYYNTRPMIIYQMIVRSDVNKAIKELL